MSRGAHNLKQGDITKAIKGTVNAGLSVKRVEIEGGKIIVFTTGGPDDPSKAGGWDDVR
jgi:molybdopterin-binding protein